MARRTRQAPFELGGHVVTAGKRRKIELPIAALMSGTPVALPVIVVHGATDGPTLWLTAALHGDEICGVEIIRQVLAALEAKEMAGTLIAVPVANVHGFNTGDRYLPDRRDLNRSFPGSARGSLASRIAHLMMKEIIARGDVGIDLHTGSDHRTNLPQVRGDLDNERVLELAEVFGAPVAMHSRTRDGSLRQAATDAGAAVLLFEGGEADRFDAAAIEAGRTGVMRVIEHLGIAARTTPPAAGPLTQSRSSKWSRAPRSGILHLECGLGDSIAKGDPVATIYDPFGKRLGAVKARGDGVVVGLTQRPLVNRGDAIAHVAEVSVG